MHTYMQKIAFKSTVYQIRRAKYAGGYLEHAVFYLYTHLGILRKISYILPV